MYATLAALLLCLTPAEYAAAEADRATFPKAEHAYCYYATTSHLVGESQTKCASTLAFVVASSSRQPIVEKCVPQEVQPGLFRLRLDELKWDPKLYQALVVAYPYSRAPGGVPLVVRADWLIVQLSDTTGSRAYYQLLYGTDKLTRDDFLKFWSVNNDPALRFGIITKSTSPIGPSVVGQRVVENRPTSQRTGAWGTLDTAKLTEQSDPLEHLDNRFKHDAEEWIVGMPKVSIAKGERGTLLAFLLANAKGERQEEAPPAIVTDHLGFRAQHAIRNFGSCVGCHKNGFLDPGVSELRAYIKGTAAGVDIYATPKALQEQIELYHLSDAAKQIARDNEDFAAGLNLVNGLNGTANAEAFRGTVASYDDEVTLETAAAELHTTPRELALAIADYNQRGAKVGARLAGLADGIPMPRTRWEQSDGWYTAYLAVQGWEAKQ